MNILAFSDVHCDVISINKILEKSKAVDLIIGAGDFSHGGGTGLKEVIKNFSQINKPCVFVPGNCETFQQLNQECKNENNLHVLHGTGINLIIGHLLIEEIRGHLATHAAPDMPVHESIGQIGPGRENHLFRNDQLWPEFPGWQMLFFNDPFHQFHPLGM